MFFWCFGVFTFNHEGRQEGGRRADEGHAVKVSVTFYSNDSTNTKPKADIMAVMVIFIYTIWFVLRCSSVAALFRSENGWNGSYLTCWIVPKHEGTQSHSKQSTPCCAAGQRRSAKQTYPSTGNRERWHGGDVTSTLTVLDKISCCDNGHIKRHLLHLLNS